MRPIRRSPFASGGPFSFITKMQLGRANETFSPFWAIVLMWFGSDLALEMENRDVILETRLLASFLALGSCTIVGNVTALRLRVRHHFLRSSQSKLTSIHFEFIFSSVIE